jgi:hypothetical protein
VRGAVVVVGGIVQGVHLVLIGGEVTLAATTYDGGKLMEENGEMD